MTSTRDIRLDHVGQFAQRGQRLLLAADIDDQRARGWHLRSAADRRAHVAAADLEALRHRLGQRLAQRRLRYGVGDEGDDGAAPTGSPPRPARGCGALRRPASVGGSRRRAAAGRRARGRVVPPSVSMLSVGQRLHLVVAQVFDRPHGERAGRARRALARDEVGGMATTAARFASIGAVRAPGAFAIDRVPVICSRAARPAAGRRADAARSSVPPIARRSRHRRGCAARRGLASARLWRSNSRRSRSLGGFQLSVGSFSSAGG